MNQRYFSFSLLTLVLLSVIALPGCGGGGDDTPASDNKVATVDVVPTTLSMEFGQVVGLTPSAKNAGGEVLVQTFTFKSENTAVATVSNSGLVCAGTWDSVTAPVVCTPGTASGSTTITVTSSGVTKSVPVNVHPRIASVQIVSTGVPCTSSTKTQQFSIRAFTANGSEITSLVGTPLWSTTSTDIATIDSAGLATARRPGATSVTAILNNVVSIPVAMSTCPPASITLKEKDSDPPVTSFTLDVNATKTIAATVIDTLGNPITDIGLTYSSSASSVANATSLGLVTAVGPGRAGIVASCSPPTCNPGHNFPVYSNLVTVAVNGTTASTVYATAANATTIVPIDTGTNTAGTAITIPTVTVNNAPVQRVVNSMVFAPDGTVAYIGTDRGLLILAAGSNTISVPGVAPVGKVLAVSPDAARVVIANAADGVVYVHSPNASPAASFVTLSIPNATAASFSPDSSRLFIASGSTLYVFSTFAPLRQYPAGSAITDVATLTQGNYTYIAGDAGNVISTRATCNDAALVSVPTANKPQFIAATYDSAHVFATDGSNAYDIAVTSGAAPCPPPNPVQSLTTTPYGMTVVPRDLIVQPDGSRFYVTNNTPQLLVYRVASGVSTINLAAGSTGSTTGGLTLDSRSLYVGALGTNDVQKVDVASGTVTQIAVNLKDKDNNVLAPEFVAVRLK